MTGTLFFLLIIAVSTRMVFTDRRATRHERFEYLDRSPRRPVGATGSSNKKRDAHE